MYLKKFSYEFKKRLSDETGAYTILGLGLLILFFIPMYAILSNLSILSNASTSASGISYNIAYSSVNRSVNNSEISRNNQPDIQAPLMFQESGVYGPVTSSNPSGAMDSINKLTGADGVYTEVSKISNAMTTTAKRGGGLNSTNFKLNTWPDVTMYTGGGSTGLTAQRNLGIIHINKKPLQANQATAAISNQNVFPAICDPKLGGGDNIGSINNDGVVCWVDSRAYDKDGNANNPVNFTNQSIINQGSKTDLINAWAHFSSGVQSNLSFTSPIALFGNSFTGNHVGVAVLARPCNPNDVSPTIGANYCIN